MTLFGMSLPKIRKQINTDLKAPNLSYRQVLATMVWILDNTYIRVGNDIYLAQNDSVGLTTLSDHNVVVAGQVVTLSFTGKSGKDHTITFDNSSIAKIVATCRALKGERLFQYKDESGAHHPITSSDVNAYLQEITGKSISAKDFRTWGGTLMAFNHLIEERETKQKPEKIAVEAIDAAADVLGNTRSVARSSYVHPHIVEVFARHQFDKYYRKLPSRRMLGIDKRENELLEFLQVLFKEEFDLVSAGK